eukprot:TRINITY_DN44328_c0_g1_i1.p1 TRINITY_DN44328_c0_g1~~TRINITY_DN44328_c0_g1_i1.p1  ORF type:complete len:386 (-),score=116.58 TRINITY_DN44328_c0_g1_i1:36-1193(-)
MAATTEAAEADLEALRQTWELMAVRQFAALFRRRLGLPELGYEELELMCINPTESHLLGHMVHALLPESMRFERFLGDAQDLRLLDVKLMQRLDEAVPDYFTSNPMRKPKPVKQKSRSTGLFGKRRRRKRRDEESVEEESVEEGAPNSEGTADEAAEAADMIRFRELPAELRLHVLRVLCDMCCEESDPVWEYCNNHVEEVRMVPVGQDAANCDIWHVTNDDCRVLREHPRGIKRGRKEPPSPKFETLSTTLEELEELEGSWRTARGRNARGKILGKYVGEILPHLQAKERARKRANEVALMPRRKSDRTAMLERKQIEEAKQAEVVRENQMQKELSLIHISEPTRLLSISYAVFCLKKKKKRAKMRKLKEGSKKDKSRDEGEMT